MIGDIPGTIDLMDEIGEPNVKLLYDVYHLWDTDDVIEHTVKHASRIVPSVHICDWRDETRNDFDRVLPGDGIIDLPAIFGALEAGGVVDWFDLEIFSDDGSFTDMDFEDSLWKQDPLDVFRRGKAGFEKAWAARKAPPEARGKGRARHRCLARARDRSRDRARPRRGGSRRRVLRHRLRRGGRGARRAGSAVSVASPTFYAGERLRPRAGRRPDRAGGRRPRARSNRRLERRASPTGRR